MQLQPRTKFGDDLTVIPFRPPQRASGRRSPTGQPADICEILDLSRYERPRAPASPREDRGRLYVDVTAMLFTVALAVAGAWTVLDIMKHQSCFGASCARASTTASLQRLR